MTVSNFDPFTARRRILERIAAAALEVGRDPASAELTAVSKQQPWTVIEPLIAGGQRIFGENRVQEATGRWRGQERALELRLIGPLQTNKLREAIDLFDVIETLDRASLAAAMAREFDRRGLAPRIYVQVNTGEEPQKAGVSPAQADDFIRSLRKDYGIEPEGLMCIPPLAEPPAPHFALLAGLARRNGLAKLSMGMSDDFETAVRLGATSVRVGRALFGPRISRGQAG